MISRDLLRAEQQFRQALVPRRRLRAVEGRLPVFVIAEAGVNHNGDIRIAERLVDAAAAAGADAIKFQTFRSESLVTAEAPQAAYQRRASPARSQLDMLKRLELSENMHRGLMSRATRLGLMFLSTPFDAASADFLRDLGIAAFKISSGEVTNLPFLRYVARFGKPIILSTGMSTLAEVKLALKTLKRGGRSPVAVLHCVSCYPAAFRDVNLRAIDTMKRRLRVPVGFSDHTLGGSAALAAAALGATIIEKHLTLDRGMKGPDHAASLAPAEFADMVRGIREVELALGSGIKAPVAAERPTARVARRSVVTAVAIPRGTTITNAMLSCKRPGTGLPPSEQSRIVGRRALRDLPADRMLRPSDFS